MINGLILEIWKAGWIFQVAKSLSLTTAGRFTIVCGLMNRGWSFREVPWIGMSDDAIPIEDLLARSILGSRSVMPGSQALILHIGAE